MLQITFSLEKLPSEYKLTKINLHINLLVEGFRIKLRKWKGEKSHCRLCKTYVQDLGYSQFSMISTVSVRL